MESLKHFLNQYVDYKTLNEEIDKQAKELASKEKGRIAIAMPINMAREFQEFLRTKQDKTIESIMDCSHHLIEARKREQNENEETTKNDENECNKQVEIGEVVNVNGTKIVCVEFNKSNQYNDEEKCKGCIFYNSTECVADYTYSRNFECGQQFRKDGKNVYFKKQPKK